MRSLLKTVFLAAMLLSTYNLKAQMYAGLEGITIKSSTIFSSEGLVLQPSADLTLDNLLAEKSATAVTVTGGSSMMRVYYFSRALTFSGTAGIYYQDAELNGNTPASLVLFHKNQFDDNTYSTLTGGTSDVPNRYVSQNFSLLTFSHITAADGNVTLPVTLISFTAKVEGNYAKLQWQTSSETNNKGFEIYRKGESLEGSGFIKIGEVSANQRTDGQLSVSTYTFLDQNPLNGNNYYKLVQTDNDGKATELGIRSLVFGLSALSLNLFPNPTTNTVTASFATGRFTQLHVTDVTGKVLQQFSIGIAESSKVVALGQYPKGVYIIRLSGKGVEEIGKVVKE